MVAAMRPRLAWLLAFLAALPSAGGVTSLADLAASGQWRRVLEVALVEARQAPLPPHRALVAAEAARRLGRAADEEALLEAAVGEDGPGQVARVRLAALRAEAAPAGAAALVLPVLSRPRTPELRRAAVAVVERARRLPPRLRRALRRAARRLPRADRRRLEAAVAAAAGEAGRRELLRLLRRSVRDRAAATAAAALERLGPRSATERLLLGSALLAQGRYEEAAPLLERAARTLRGWKAPFRAGRCAYRRERYGEAAAWYLRALRRAPDARRRAELLVHLARARLAAGDLPAALEAARRAVRARPSDARRLLLADLELQAGNRRRAEASIGRLRTREGRDRGRILLALERLRAGDGTGAVRLLDSVRGRRWGGAAQVVAARLELALGDGPGALRRLERAARIGLGPYWEEAARATTARLPAETVDAWRDGVARAWRERGDAGALAEWAALEPDPARLAAVRAAVAPRFRPPRDIAPRRGLAARLWSLGLHQAAARWDASNLPHGDPAAAGWAAARLAAAGRIRRAMALADEARRRMHPRAPVALLPERVARTLYPLPMPVEVRRAAEKAGVDWALLAALVREESAWDPGAVSAVGARGLTQLMPATARRVAGALGEPEPDPEALHDPARSLRLGAAELARLLRRSGGRAERAVAAYNAGERAAARWAARCPEPCTPELYLLAIGYGATRAYTADVLAAAAWYRRLYAP